MSIGYNEKYLESIKKYSFDKERITKSFEKKIVKGNFIFRVNHSWFQFDNWSPPNSGIIRQWKAKNDDWIPKFNYTSSINVGNSRIILDLKNLPKNLANYNIQQVTLSPRGNLLLILIESKGNYDYLIIKNGSLDILFTIKDVALESSFYLSETGILFCRMDSLSRPNQLYYRNFETNQEKLIFTETKIERRIHIRKTGSVSNGCFVSSKDFRSGSLFFYKLDKERINSIPLVYNDIIPRVFDVVIVDKNLYFLNICRSDNYCALYLDGLDDKARFEIPLVNKKVKSLSCIGKTILLNTSNNIDFSYHLLRLDSLKSLNYTEEELTFQGETEIYENNFSSEFIFFIEQSVFSETLFSYNFLSNKLTKEFTHSVIQGDNKDKYCHSLLWTDKNKDGIRIPISLYWRDNHPIAKIPKNKKCIFFVYGAYGKTDRIEPEPAILSILDAGFIFIIIHVRGGGFLGGDWYRMGRELNKKNSINDFIEGVEYLISNEIVNEKHLGLMSSSAGGLVAGATLNERPQMFKSMLLFSPFIDPYNALMNKNDPLARMEVFEWGDISNNTVKEYINSYSPRQNVNKARNSKTKVINILGKHDQYINNYDVLHWSDALNFIGVESIVYINPIAGHGGISQSDNELFISSLNYFLGVVNT